MKIIDKGGDKMKTIEAGYYRYVPTKDIEVSQRKRVYKAYFLDEFVGYRVKTKGKQLVNGKEKSVGFEFKPCKKAYTDDEGVLRFILA